MLIYVMSYVNFFPGMGGSFFEFVASFCLVSTARVRIHRSLGLDFDVFFQCSSSRHRNKCKFLVFCLFRFRFVLL